MVIKRLAKSAAEGAEKAIAKGGSRALTLAEKAEAKKLALTPFDKKVGRETNPISKRLNINKYNETPPAPFKLTAEQKANNERLLKNINNKKNGGAVKKAQMGANLGKVKSQMEDFKKYDNAKKSPLSTGYMVPVGTRPSVKSPSKSNSPKSSMSTMKKGGTIKKKK